MFILFLLWNICWISKLFPALIFHIEGRSVHPSDYAETVCGTPLYMAPEVLQFQRYDEKVRSFLNLIVFFWIRNNLDSGLCYRLTCGVLVQFFLSFWMAIHLFVVGLTFRYHHSPKLRVLQMYQLQSPLKLLFPSAATEHQDMYMSSIFSVIPSRFASRLCRYLFKATVFKSRFSILP